MWFVWQLFSSFIIVIVLVDSGFDYNETCALHEVVVRFESTLTGTGELV